MALADGIFTLEWRIERDEVKAGSEPRTLRSLYSSIELLSVASWFRYYELVHLFSFLFARNSERKRNEIKVALRIRPTFPLLCIASLPSNREVSVVVSNCDSSIKI